MDFQLTEKQFALQSLAHEFARREIRPIAHEREKIEDPAKRFPWDVVEKGSQLGLRTLALPEDMGGAGADVLTLCLVGEELAWGDLGVAVTFDQTWKISHLIEHLANDEQRARYLPAFLEDHSFHLAIAMTEPSAGSDLQNIQTTAIRDGDEYRISGQKVFITNGQLSDIVITACKTDPQAGGKGVSLVLVETDRPGFKRGRNLEKIGWKAQDTSELFFDEVRVPASNLLGQEGRGFVQHMEQLPQERLLQAIRAATTIEAALEWTVDYTTTRRAFDRPIAAFQNTRFKLADVKSQALMLRVFVDRCIAMHLEGRLDAVDAAVVKLLSSEMLGKLLDECLQLFGGYGYMWEYPIARAWADARMSRIAGGTCEIMREIIGRSIVGRG